MQFSISTKIDNFQTRFKKVLDERRNGKMGEGRVVKRKKLI